MQIATGANIVGWETQMQYVYFISPFVAFFCGNGYSPLESNQHKIA